MEKIISKSDIWLVNLEPSRKGEFGKRARPAVVVQSNDGNEILDTITIMPISSDINQFDELHILLKPTKTNGLSKQSAAICSHIYTLSKESFIRRLGFLTKQELEAITRAVLLHLDIDLF